MAIKIVKRYFVSPSSQGGAAAAEQSFPLVYFDMIFLLGCPTQDLFFYDFKCSESCFLETIAEELTNSLSIALRHFHPLAGKIIFPLSSAGRPISQYKAGDSVALTIAISDADLANLTANHSKAANEFHHFAPQLPQAVYSNSDDAIIFSVVAVQATLLPNQGICVAITHHRAICDWTSLFGFVHAWASIHKRNSDDRHFVGNAMPFYDRSYVQDANKLDTICWNQVKTSRPTVSLPINSSPLQKVRATFALTDADIKKLKTLALIKKPQSIAGRVSTFAVVCAHLWSCLAAAAGEEVADDEPEYFATSVNCRARLNPPLPETYFGNCLVSSWADSTHRRLKGSEGFLAAVEAITSAIRRTVENPRGVLDDFENELQRDAELIGIKRVVSIAGSLKFDLYSADYGWGRAIKYECIHIDFNGEVSVCKGRDGGVEIGMSMPGVEMDAFAAIFNRNLYITSNL